MKYPSAKRRLSEIVYMGIPWVSLKININKHMKIKFLLGVLAIGAVTALNSCKDDEVPVAGVNFEAEEQEVTESDGTIASFHPDEDEDGVGRIIPVKLVFDIPLAGDAVFTIDIDGSARQTSSTSTGELNDFTLEAEGEMLAVDGNKITVLKGATEAVLNVRIFEDFSFELEEDSELNEDGIPYETIEITLDAVTSGPAKLGDALTHTVKILEDDSYIYLDWTVDNTTTPGNANMDLLVYINNNYAGRSASSDANNPYELIVIPGAFPSTTYGLGYVYKSGASNDVDFRVEIANYGGMLTKASGGTAAAVFQFSGAYDQTNLNDYPTPSATAIPNTNKTQTMVKNALDYTGVTELSIPETGSREVNKVSHEQILRRLKAGKLVVLKNTVK
jgi:hypothetical protein